MSSYFVDKKNYYLELIDKISKLEKELQNIEISISAARTIISRNMNKNLILRAKAFLKEIMNEYGKESDIGYRLLETHQCEYTLNNRGNSGWVSELNDEEKLLYDDLKRSFDEVSFIMSYTKYDEYDSGHFFRRS